MSGGLDLVRKVLALLPVVRSRQGIRVVELAKLTGIPAREIVSDLPKLVNLCGVPPYSPVDLVDLHIEGDRVTIRFADQFRRPGRLTLGESLALSMALAGWERGEGPLASTVASIRTKVAKALSPEVAEEVARAEERIASAPRAGRASEMLSAVQQALARQIAMKVAYFSMGSGRLSERVVRPYGFYESGGHFYVVGLSDPPGRVMTFRTDRIRSATPTEEEYEIPEDFQVARYRPEGLPRLTAKDANRARIRFEPSAARFARELFPATDLAEDGDELLATVTYTSEFWLVSELLRWGGKARVESPPELAERLAERARSTLALYRQGP